MFYIGILHVTMGIKCLPLYCSFAQVQQLHKLLLRVKNRSATCSAALLLSPDSTRPWEGFWWRDCAVGSVCLEGNSAATDECVCVCVCPLHILHALILHSSHWPCVLLGNKKDCISSFRQVPSRDGEALADMLSVSWEGLELLEEGRAEGGRGARSRATRWCGCLTVLLCNSA